MAHRHAQALALADREVLVAFVLAKDVARRVNQLAGRECLGLRRFTRPA
jgi:hypothetical protein